MQLVQGHRATAASKPDCSLVGGETAILPDFYQPGDFDMAGFCDRRRRTRRTSSTARRIAVGDAVIGLASSGIHSNGYSLVRKVVFEAAGLKVDRSGPGTGQDGRRGAADADAALREADPPAVLDITRSKKGVIHGLANITGGGLPDNIGRILPPGKRVRDSARCVAGAAGLRLAAEAGQRGRAGDVPRLQHGHRLRGDCRRRARPTASWRTWIRMASPRGASAR